MQNSGGRFCFKNNGKMGAAIVSLLGGLISNKQSANANTATALNTLYEQAEQQQKEIKIWRSVFFASVVIAIILIVVLVFSKRR